MATPLALRVAEAEARVYRRVWRGSVVSSFLNPVLYLLAMGVGLGSLVDRNLPSGVAGVPYLAFLAPGLLVGFAFQTGAGEGAWKVMAGFKWRKTYDAVLATPVGVPALVAGHLLWSATRVAMVSVVFGLVMVAFGVTGPVAALAAAVPGVLVGMAVNAPVTAFTANLEGDGGLPALFRFVVIPMFLFSGTFFPITQLPGWMQPVAYATPLFHGVELARAWALGSPPAVPPLVAITVLLGWFLAGALLAVRAFERRLRR